jgi:hypothetical protein
MRLRIVKNGKNPYTIKLQVLHLFRAVFEGCKIPGTQDEAGKETFNWHCVGNRLTDEDMIVHNFDTEDLKPGDVIEVYCIDHDPTKE